MSPISSTTPREPRAPAGGHLYHVVTGKSGYMWNVDMRDVLARFPDEWKDRPWTEKEVDAYKRKHKTDAAA